MGILVSRYPSYQRIQYNLRSGRFFRNLSWREGVGAVFFNTFSTPSLFRSVLPKSVSPALPPSPLLPPPRLSFGRVRSMMHCINLIRTECELESIVIFYSYKIIIKFPQMFPGKHILLQNIIREILV